MPQAGDEFFQSKDFHPWSRVKDQILASYVTAYLAKISKRQADIILIDAFAGPGVTEDGEPGSPLIIIGAAERLAKGRYTAYFVNKKRKHHRKLKSILEYRGLAHSAIAVLDDGPTYLSTIAQDLGRESVLLYVDPYGLNCAFGYLEPFLNRSRAYSTDLLINLQIPAAHRLAAKNATNNGKCVTDRLSSGLERLTRAFGGDYWKEFIYSDEKPNIREKLLADEYKRRLASTGYLTYTGVCPIQEYRGGATKYYLIFASRHPDAMVICNDAMCKSVNEYLYHQEMGETLFSDISWKDWRDTSELDRVVVRYVETFPGRTRKDLWLPIIQDNFMNFTESEYKKSVSALVNSGEIICTTPIGSPQRKTKRLNDNCVLEPRS
ncbi:MAG: three-Cys-motif partner protein TcmP [Anaerolineae bacterium]|nr:three-Cys-motif partner protein TcmP [Anaerolineae bacterium]